MKAWIPSALIRDIRGVPPPFFFAPIRVPSRFNLPEFRDFNAER